jgi:glycosyltransferase involved in cell wall biosynthesis
MRVVDIINASTSADTLLRERVLAMRAHGIDNHIVCADGPRVEALRALGIPVHTADVPRNLDPWKLAVALAQISAYLRRTQADVVHTHCAIPGLIGRLAGRLAGVPVIIHTAHGFHFHEGTPWAARIPYLAVERLCGRVTDTLLTQNWSDLEQAERYRLGPAGRRRHIGNGIDLTRFQPVASRPQAGAVPTITCVARLEPVKNHGMLLEAAAILKRRGIPFRLRLVGDGPLRDRYQELCRRTGIEREVEFLGYRTDIPELLAETDVAVLTSLKEGLPRAAIEAMAMGLPVVATVVPGTREVVRYGETGLGVEVGDAEGLASALAMEIGDPAQRARHGAQGRAVALQEFDERRIVEQLRELYHSRLCAREAGAQARPFTRTFGDGLPGSRARAER